MMRKDSLGEKIELRLMNDIVMLESSWDAQATAIIPNTFVDALSTVSHFCYLALAFTLWLNKTPCFAFSTPHVDRMRRYH